MTRFTFWNWINLAVGIFLIPMAVMRFMEGNWFWFWWDTIFAVLNIVIPFLPKPKTQR